MADLSSADRAPAADALRKFAQMRDVLRVVLAALSVFSMGGVVFGLATLYPVLYAASSSGCAARRRRVSAIRRR